MVELDVAESYQDENGNEIVFDGRLEGNVTIVFRGRNNRLEIHPEATFRELNVQFDCDNGTALFGHSVGSSWRVRVGEDATVRVGRGVTTTEVCGVSAVEGTTIRIGNDVMIASEVQIRGDDGHPIFDVRTGVRVNPAKSILVGHHVWLGWGVLVLGGAKIRAGSVIGAKSVVTRKIPNNCIAAGAPAKVVRRDIAWERPHLSLAEPPYKPDISTIVKTERWWNLTEDSPRSKADGSGKSRGAGLRRRAERLRDGLRESHD
ncbi:MAG: acyltransferase [Propionibacteriales bacterium]|nr:acyltransferase [Propionibacteriales bacterium]